MTIYDWMEQERTEWALAQPVAREMQAEYFTVINDLLEIIKALDFPPEKIIIREDDEE